MQSDDTPINPTMTHTDPFTGERFEWIASRAYFAGGDTLKGALILANESDVYSNRILGLGRIWYVHIRSAHQQEGDRPVTSLRLTDAERRELIRQLGGTVEEEVERHG